MIFYFYLLFLFFCFYDLNIDLSVNISQFTYLPSDDRFAFVDFL